MRFITGGIALVACCSALVVSGCYTRLTTPKEAREWRGTYPELEANQTVMLQNARANLDNTFIMTIETYTDLMDRYGLYGGGAMAPGGGEPFRFRAGSIIDIKLPSHPDDPINKERYVIRPEGTIDIGPLSDFPVAGKTAKEIREELSRALATWYKSFPEENALPRVNVNLPVFDNSLLGDRTQWGEATILALGGTGGGAAGTSRVQLRGNDTVLTTLASVYSSTMDWREIAIRRKIVTTRKDPKTNQFIEYYIYILVDLEKLIYEDPNLDMDIRDGDLIITHIEKNPLIVEILESARLISGIWSDFSGVETVLEDIFKRNF
ncbi:MAG: polysaccharide biosynthesis/export family protein [Planctomycetes bacterium]|nr:polysaccharide biosynthesis/export family protein [Planctomycetota bacterium]NUQ33762.1 polysaccharide biosynthesis/export family protein [Planctomycetaceae bacterium]